MFSLFICPYIWRSSAPVSEISTNSSLSIWVPAAVAILSLLVNTCFVLLISPRISEKHNQKVAMYNICIEYFDYLTDLVSFSSFDGVPSKIRKFSLKIHMMFKSGVAPKPIDIKLESIYQKVKERKNLEDQDTISDWEKEYRVLLRDLRIELSKYIGVFSK